MSDGFDLGFGSPGGSATLDDDEIILDMSPESTGGLLSDRCPVGVHRFQIIGYDMEETKLHEPMVNVQLVVLESSDPANVGARHNERLMIPSKAQRCCGEDPHKPKCSWAGSMKFLRMRLEGMTGREFREDQLRLSPKRDLMDVVFVATCTHVETPQLDPETQEPTGKTYVNAELSNYVPVPAGTSGPAPNDAGVAPVSGYQSAADEPF